MRAVHLTRLAHQLVNVLLAASILGCVVALLTGHGLSFVLFSLVISLSTVVTTVMQWRSVTMNQRLGRIEEQTHVMLSMVEAKHREMTFEEWLQAYSERSAMEWRE